MKTQIVKENQTNKAWTVHLHLRPKLGDRHTSESSLLGHLDLGTEQIDPVQTASVVASCWTSNGPSKRIGGPPGHPLSFGGPPDTELFLEHVRCHSSSSWSLPLSSSFSFLLLSFAQMAVRVTLLSSFPIQVITHGQTKCALSASEEQKIHLALDQYHMFPFHRPVACAAYPKIFMVGVAKPAN